MVTYRKLHIFTVLLPTLIIGGFEYFRHTFLLPYLSMKTGNHVITVLTFILSNIYAAWMFRTIRQMNDRLAQEQSRRAVSEERCRLARELHDGIAQSLFFLNIKMKQGLVDEAQVAVSEIDSYVRQAIFNLRCSPEESWALRDRITKWLREWSMLSGIEVIQDMEFPDEYFTPSEEVLLFGIIQETFTNIRKHANAHQVQFSLCGTEKSWQLHIVDDGIGVGKDVGQGTKYGITLMKERASQLGATFVLRMGENGGTELLVEDQQRGVVA